jgi:8-oxo-dGTP diphosphatase
MVVDLRQPITFQPGSLMIERINPEYMKRTADLLQKSPRATRILVNLMRLTRARFTSGVVGVVLNEVGNFLLVKHVFHPEYPWGLPGGWIERRESPREALERELYEELGIVVEIGAPLAVESGWRHSSHLDIAYLCETAEAVKHISPELLDYRWVPMKEAPRLAPFHQMALDLAAARTMNEVNRV